MTNCRRRERRGVNVQHFLVGAYQRRALEEHTTHVRASMPVSAFPWPTVGAESGGCTGGRCSTLDPRCWVRGGGKHQEHPRNRVPKIRSGMFLKSTPEQESVVMFLPLTFRDRLASSYFRVRWCGANRGFAIRVLSCRTQNSPVGPIIRDYPEIDGSKPIPNGIPESRFSSVIWEITKSHVPRTYNCSFLFPLNLKNRKNSHNGNCIVVFFF